MRPSQGSLGVAVLIGMLGVTLPAMAASLAFTKIDAPGATFTVAGGITDSGQIVGIFYDAGGKVHGFVRGAAGTFTTIDVPGAKSTQAQGINDAGKIVGYFQDVDGKRPSYVTTR